jgi:hypothetical protein
VGEDGKSPASAAPGTLILTLDRMEMPAIVVPPWAEQGTSRDVMIPVEYACVPPGADGDYYEHGHLYYDGMRIDKEPGLQHGDARGTLLIDIVTYAERGGGNEE